ncbi:MULTISPECIES: TIGR04452 family lipoprotein [Leptospira]|uniref:TIGR04452 family lipoprotein n=1 Tax=Leptospira TaxID=171 RepID=UPI000248B3D8|nr:MULTISPECIES: TIGR04452 family lipoprotein [Leptospira]
MTNCLNCKKSRFLVRLTLFLCFSFYDCNLLNEAGLADDRLKGSEVKQRIQDAVNTYVAVAASYDPSVLTASNALLNAQASSLAGINSGDYYHKSDVDKCISEIQTWGYLIRSPGFIAMIQCHLKPSSPIY